MRNEAPHLDSEADFKDDVWCPVADAHIRLTAYASPRAAYVTDRLEQRRALP